MKKKILIVDDDADIVDLLKAILEMKGYEIIEAFDGREAIEKAYERKPDLILLDIMMPVMDGWEVCQRLKACKKTSHLPVAIVTTRDGRSDRKRAVKEGVADYITKPFQPDDFMQRIKRVLKESDSSGRLPLMMLA